MSKEIIKPLGLSMEVDFARLDSVKRDDSGVLEILFSITMPGTMSARLTFPYTLVFAMDWIDIACLKVKDDEQDESNNVAFTVIENSEYLSKLKANKDLGIDSNLKHYKLWFRDEAIDIIAPEPKFEIIKDWSAPDLDKQ